MLKRRKIETILGKLNSNQPTPYANSQGNSPEN
jgi:hypothetical protein